jgi:hypothetical protein
MAKRYWEKALTVMIAGAFVIMGLSSLALAQKGQELKDAAQMMQDGWKQFNDGQRMVIQGKEMNDLVAVQGGFQDKMVQGNKVIQDGRVTMDRGAKLYARGEKAYLKHKKNHKMAKQGLKMMSDGFKMANGDGVKMVKQGVDMNNQVAQAAGAMDKFSQGNQVIQTGFQNMEGGAKLFMQGEEIYLQLK